MSKASRFRTSLLLAGAILATRVLAGDGPDGPYDPEKPGGPQRQPGREPKVTRSAKKSHERMRGRKHVEAAKRSKKRLD